MVARESEEHISVRACEVRLPVRRTEAVESDGRRPPRARAQAVGVRRSASRSRGTARAPGATVQGDDRSSARSAWLPFDRESMRLTVGLSEGSACRQRVSQPPRVVIARSDPHPRERGWAPRSRLRQPERRRSVVGEAHMSVMPQERRLHCPTSPVQFMSVVRAPPPMRIAWSPPRLSFHWLVARSSSGHRGPPWFRIHRRGATDGWSVSCLTETSAGDRSSRIAGREPWLLISVREAGDPAALGRWTSMAAIGSTAPR